MKIQKNMTITIALLLFAGAGCKQKQEVTEPKMPDIMFQAAAKPDDIFTLSRAGERVTIQWTTDFSACRAIEVWRNTTGIAGHRYRAAHLDASARQYVDTVPDGSHYWYWLKVMTHDRKEKFFGPLRVDPDAEKTGHYKNVADIYPASVNRTDSKASIRWDFPRGKYRQIRFVRNSNPRSYVRKEMHRTLEWKGELIDDLPDVDADYWYWVEISLESGTTELVGPLKANFVE
jgi:hypothetical protein